MLVDSTRDLERLQQTIIEAINQKKASWKMKNKKSKEKHLTTQKLNLYRHHVMFKQWNEYMESKVAIVAARSEELGFDNDRLPKLTAQLVSSTL